MFWDVGKSKCKSKLWTPLKPRHPDKTGSIVLWFMWLNIRCSVQINAHLHSLFNHKSKNNCIISYINTKCAASIEILLNPLFFIIFSNTIKKCYFHPVNNIDLFIIVTCLIINSKLEKPKNNICLYSDSTQIVLTIICILLYL